jgi:hypothetical protein
MTAGEMAIDCGLAATVWWIYGVLTRERTAQSKVEKHAICALLSTCVFGIANSPHFWREDCFDCFARHGVPLFYFHEGGFAGGAGFVWTGVVGNTVVVLFVALLLALANRKHPVVRLRREPHALRVGVEVSWRALERLRGLLRIRLGALGLLEAPTRRQIHRRRRRRGDPRHCGCASASACECRCSGQRRERRPDQAVDGECRAHKPVRSHGDGHQP